MYQLTVTQLTVLALLLCIPAFLINLGAVAFIGDEGIRTLVALEMKLSGNFLVPTLNGIEYYNKPPLYNWFIYSLSMLFGYFGEWPTRLTTIISLGLYGFLVYYFNRKHFDKLTAITMSFMLFTSGRILFWDSMLGLIDICFSLVIFSNFMVLYFFGAKRRWKSFFILSYLLFAIAFLLKGLPAILFQGISILTALWLQGELRKKIFSVDHMMGIGAGSIVLLAYYIPYASMVSLDNVFSVLLDQSMQRTGTHHGTLKTILHLFTFPFEQVYHFLPWSLLGLTFFHPKAKTWINQDPFIRFNFWMFLANILVYWFSVEVYPRYLLMFLPLFNIVTYYLLQQSIAHHKLLWQILRYTFICLAGAVAIIILAMPVDLRVRELEHVWFIWLTGSFMIIICIIGMLKDEKRLFLWLCIAMLITRSVFNLVVLPDRKMTFQENKCREDCKRLALLYGDHAWFIYGKTETHEVARFYTSNYTRQIIQKTKDVTDPSAYFLVDRKIYPYLDGSVIDSLQLERGQIIYLMKLWPQ